MFYAIRQEMDPEACVETGRVYVAMGADPETVAYERSDFRTFDSVDEAKADYGMVRWSTPDAEAAPDVLAVGYDEEDA